MPSEQDSLTVSYTASFDDVLRLQRYIASGSRRSSAYWSVRRFYLIVAAIIQLVLPLGVVAMTIAIIPVHLRHYPGWYKGVEFLLWWLFAGLVYLFAAFFGDQIACAASVAKSPWVLGANSATIGPQGILLKTPDREAAYRIPYFTRIGWDCGDLYLFPDASSAFRIPMRAFGNIDRSMAAYEAISSSLDLASPSAFDDALTEEKGQEVWPPMPRFGQSAPPLPTLGSMEFGPLVRLDYALAERDYLAVQNRESILLGGLAAVTMVGATAVLVHGGTVSGMFAVFACAVIVVIVIVAALNKDNPAIVKRSVTGRAVRTQAETLATDFVELRIESADAKLCYRVGSLQKVAEFPQHIVIYATAKLSHIVPKRAFGTPEAAGEFVSRLRAAIKSERTLLAAGHRHSGEEINQT